MFVQLHGSVRGKLPHEGFRRDRLHTVLLQLGLQQLTQEEIFELVVMTVDLAVGRDRYQRRLMSNLVETRQDLLVSEIFGPGRRDGIEGNGATQPAVVHHNIERSPARETDAVRAMRCAGNAHLGWRKDREAQALS